MTPYPLVKGYLAREIADAESAGQDGAGNRLVILDATDPEQSVVSVATMAAVLDAQQGNAKQVSVELKLTFDSKTDGYVKLDS